MNTDLAFAGARKSFALFTKLFLLVLLSACSDRSVSAPGLPIAQKVETVATSSNPTLTWLAPVGTGIANPTTFDADVRRRRGPSSRNLRVDRKRLQRPARRTIQHGTNAAGPAVEREHRGWTVRCCLELDERELYITSYISDTCANRSCRNRRSFSGCGPWSLGTDAKRRDTGAAFFSNQLADQLFASSSGVVQCEPRWTSRRLGLTTKHCDNLVCSRCIRQSATSRGRRCFGKCIADIRWQLTDVRGRASFVTSGKDSLCRRRDPDLGL
jgi:hypothetical protein